jgi:hypothetical protein
MNRDRMISSLAQKINNSVGHRADLQLADVRKISKTAAHFMIAYHQDKAPTADDITRFFINKFEAKVTPHISTAKVYGNEKVVTVVAGILNVSRDIEDIQRSGLKAVIAGVQYLDVPLQETYDVVERNGKKVLVRKVKDDIMAIVSARRNAMMDSSSTKTFASVATGNSLDRYLAILDKGDVVKALIDDKVVECEVTAAAEGEVKVRCGGKMLSISRGEVLEIVRKASSVEKAREGALQDYYSKAYGDPNYAKSLVK